LRERDRRRIAANGPRDEVTDLRYVVIGRTAKREIFEVEAAGQCYFNLK
jgi:hypothetical protein